MTTLRLTLPLLVSLLDVGALVAAPHTEVAIRGENFLVGGRPTYAGRAWQGVSIEGRLFNSRMVQGVFDDLNPATRARWNFPDGSPWDPDRNTREFIAAMPEWRRHGLLAFTLNLQGGSPEGYSKEQPWENPGFTANGTLLPAYAARATRILDRADELGMVVILGLFYFGQDQRLADEAAVIRAVDQTVDWVFTHGWRNVLIEINNESTNGYDHAILRPDRVHELIERVRGTVRDGRRLLVSTSYTGRRVPDDGVVRVADFVLIHGNGTASNPALITQMVRQTRELPSWRPMPIVFNEDDHFDFDKPDNNFVAAVRAGASWGYFDYRMKDEGFADGYQSVPVDWGINSPRKKAFFAKLREITGGLP